MCKLFLCVLVYVSSVCGVCACVLSKRSRVHIQNVSVCAVKTQVSYVARAYCRHTRRRFECTHGAVLNLHTVVFFQRATPNTPPHTSTHTRQDTNNTPHTPTRHRHTHQQHADTHTHQQHTTHIHTAHTHTHSAHTHCTVLAHWTPRKSIRVGTRKMVNCA